MQPQPLIVVSDVEASSRWYQKLLYGESAHGWPEYERLTHDGKLITQLHAGTCTTINILAIPIQSLSATACCCGFKPMNSTTPSRVPAN